MTLTQYKRFILSALVFAAALISCSDIIEPHSSIGSVFVRLERRRKVGAADGSAAVHKI